MKYQRQQILDLLVERGSIGVYVYELNSAWPKGLGVSQYGRCIKELRERGYNIINTVPGHFVLKDGVYNGSSKLEASTGHTQPSSQPQNPWEVETERVEHPDGHVTYEEKQLSL